MHAGQGRLDVGGKLHSNVRANHPVFPRNARTAASTGGRVLRPLRADAFWSGQMLTIYLLNQLDTKQTLPAGQTQPPLVPHTNLAKNGWRGHHSSGHISKRTSTPESCRSMKCVSDSAEGNACRLRSSGGRWRPAIQGAPVPHQFSVKRLYCSKHCRQSTSTPAS